MARAETSIDVARPPDEVFAIVGDAANDPRWRKNVVRTEWRDDVPMRPGRRGRQTSRLLGREWTVEAEGDPTRLSGDGEGGSRGRLGGLMTRLVVPGVARQVRADLRAPRDYLEPHDGQGGSDPSLQPQDSHGGSHR